MELRKRKKIDYNKKQVRTTPNPNPNSSNLSLTVSRKPVKPLLADSDVIFTDPPRINTTISKSNASGPGFKKNKSGKRQSMAPRNNIVQTTHNQISHKENGNTNVVTKIEQNDTTQPINTNLDKIVVTVLERPSMKTNFELEETIDSIDTMEFYSKNLARLIDLQYEIYYKNLKKPALLGPKKFESLKVPNDIINLKKIHSGWLQLVEDLKKIETEKARIDLGMNNCFDTPEYLPNCDMNKINDLIVLSSEVETRKLEEKYKSSSLYNTNGNLNQPMIQNNATVNEEDTLITAVSKIHGINCDNLKEIKSKNLTVDGKVNFDPNFIDPNEIRTISRKIDKPLLREKNNNLNWPNKIKKKKIRGKDTHPMEIDNPTLKFRDVPLFH